VPDTVEVTAPGILVGRTVCIFRRRVGIAVGRPRLRVYA